MLGKVVILIVLKLFFIEDVVLSVGDADLDALIIYCLLLWSLNLLRVVLLDLEDSHSCPFLQQHLLGSVIIDPCVADLFRGAVIVEDV